MRFGDGAMTARFDQLLFDALCDAAQVAIQRAASNDWYDIEPDYKAVRKAQEAMREARRMGLIPTTAELERESRRAA